MDKLSRNKEVAPYFKILSDKILDYFWINDLKNKTNDCKIFKALYLHQYQNKTITIECNISSATLTRYIQKYEEIAALVIRNLKELYEIIKYIE